MTVPTLAEFLLARIAEDEGMAKEAWPDRWTVRHGNTVESEAPDPRESYGGESTQVARLAMTVGKFQREAANADHIARHDPARVLSECEAKRRIVGAWGRLYLSPPLGDEYARQAGETAGHVFRCLALPYADHPDYREEWRP